MFRFSREPPLLGATRKKQPTMAPRQAGFIAWRNSEAKELILDALQKGHIPLEETEMSTREACEHFRFKPPFVGPPAVQVLLFAAPRPSKVMNHNSSASDVAILVFASLWIEFKMSNSHSLFMGFHRKVSLNVSMTFVSVSLMSLSPKMSLSPNVSVSCLLNVSVSYCPHV